MIDKSKRRDTPSGLFLRFSHASTVLAVTGFIVSSVFLAVIFP
jgi:hypothetical protein